MSHTLFALYQRPVDEAAFDAHYEQTHSKLGATLPGLRSFTGTKPGPDADGEPAPHYFVAMLTFDDESALASALSGPEGERVVADLANFAGAGVTLLNGASVTYV